MSGNCYEWSTETGMLGGTIRGASYADNGSTTNMRDNREANNTNASISFRPILYL